MKPYLLLFTLWCIVSCSSEQKTELEKDNLVGLFNKLQKQRWNNTDSMGLFADSLHNLTKGQGNDLEAMGEIALASFHQKKSNYDEAFLHLKLADSILAVTGTDSLKAKLHNIYGIIHRFLGNYDISVTHYLQALRIYEQLNFEEGIGGINNNLAQLYQQKENYPAALAHADKALEIFKDNPTHIVYLLAAQNKASTYLLLNKPDSALVIDSIGIAISRQLNNKLLLSAFLNNKGKSFLRKKIYDSAKHYYRESFLLDSTSNDKQFMADTYLQLGDMAIQQNEDDKATYYLQQSLKIGHTIRHKKTLYEAWSLLSALYSARGDYRSALEAKDSSRYWQNISVNEKTERRLAELNTQYETDKKIDQIALQKTQLSRQRIIIIGIVSVALLLIALAVVQLRKAKLKKQQELQAAIFDQQQKAAAAVIRAEEKERGRIAAELHDGVGQTMTAAWLNLQALQDESKIETSQQELFSKTILLVDDSCKEIRQVSHDLMPISLQKKTLVPALQEYIQKISNAKLQITMQAENVGRVFSHEEGLMLFRVIQECIQNASKHAHAKRLDISFNEDEKGLDILLEDDGIGFDTTTINNGEGIGLQSIVSRINYLKGLVQWDSSPGKGTLIIIQLPPNEN
jgi:two-component system NarL family sensor kinase